MLLQNYHLLSECYDSCGAVRQCGPIHQSSGPQCSPNGYDKHMRYCHTMGVYYCRVVCITIQLISVDSHVFFVIDGKPELHNSTEWLLPSYEKAVLFKRLWKGKGKLFCMHVYKSTHAHTPQPWQDINNIPISWALMWSYLCHSDALLLVWPSPA